MKNDTRLDDIAKRAKAALVKAREAEADAWEAWREYGQALNEGRDMFTSNNGFHDWMVSRQLGGTHDHERAAAMWIARRPGEEAHARSLFPDPKTPRGLHTKWKGFLVSVETLYLSDLEDGIVIEPEKDETPSVENLSVMEERPYGRTLTHEFVTRP